MYICSCLREKKVTDLAICPTSKTPFPVSHPEDNSRASRSLVDHALHPLQTFLWAFQSFRWHSTEQ